MCFHNSMSAKVQKLASRYGLKTDIVEIHKDILDEKQSKGLKTNSFAEGVYHYSAFNEPECMIVTESDELQVMQWGLIPKNTKFEDMLRYNRENWFKNARSEKIFETWPYRTSIESRRCIIPSTGYFEYHLNDDKSTTPYYIFLKDQEIFSIAGIWDVWINPQTKETMKSFTLITTEANPLTAEIHNGGKNPHRMPVILKKEDEEKWLNSKLDKLDIESLLKPFDEKEIDAYRISNDFIKKNPKDESILERIK